MGRAFVEGMAGLELGLSEMVGMHLRSNLYPPVPLIMVDACCDAIDAYNELDYSRSIDLPDGVSWKGLSHAPAHAIIENHRLEAFLDNDEEF